jgi:carbamoyltransferase
MRYCGFSEFFHDAGIAFITSDGDIEFAAHAERYSKHKNDPELPESLMQMIRKDDHTSFYEDYELRKKWNNIGLNASALGDTILYLTNPHLEKSIVCDTFIPHHISHAAGGYYTRPWESKEDTVILTIDGAGEYQTSCIFDSNFKLLHEEVTPKSIGYFYSFMTKYLGLKPLEDEYVVMGLSAYGEPVIGEDLIKIYNSLDTKDIYNWFKQDLVSIRIQAKAVVWGEIKKLLDSKDYSKEDLAASVQYFAEKEITKLAKLARTYGSKLVYSGGCAQNVVANSIIRKLFDDMWIPVAPTDAGSSLGAAAYSYGKATGRDRINWVDPYLGYDITRSINPKEVVNYLLEHTYCGIANGRAEFGPRALGNRSLIADVRYDVKDTVNAIKQRQEYRPFAPAILEEFADQYFEGPMNEYMQYTAKALHDYKSVTHIDGTARVQIVRKDCKSVFRKVIEEYYERTGVPMLLNTSLNIRGMPIVNDVYDATIFQKRYSVKVF